MCPINGELQAGGIKKWIGKRGFTFLERSKKITVGRRNDCRRKDLIRDELRTGKLRHRKRKNLWEKREKRRG